MSFYQTMRDAYANSHPHTYQGEAPLKRHMPATTDTRAANTTGDRIDGEFITQRTKDGQLIFIGIDGQYIRKA